MLDAQGVVDLLLELDVRVDFVRHVNGSVKPYTGASARDLRTLAVSVRALCHFNLDSFGFCYRRCREVHFQHSVAELRRDFRAVGIFRQREAASESAIASLDAMEFSFLIFLLGFAFSGNAKNTVFDSYPNVILLHFRQVSFEKISVIILADINLR
jgi:hypothetical protein